jgi:chromosome segregation ATPase
MNMDVIEGVRAAIKEKMLPELDRIREENKEIKSTLVMINKRLDDVNLHMADQSRRIDATREELSARIDESNNRINETNKRIGETNKRIDSMSQKFDIRLDRLYEVIVRRDEHQATERRIAVLEKDVAEIRHRLAA